MATDKIPFNLRLPQELLEELREIAAREKRSINNTIEYFVQQGIDRYRAEEDFKQKNLKLK